MSAPESGDISDKQNVEPTDPIEPTVDIAQPDAPAPPAESPQTFKCDKCGATFTDEGSAAAHIQTCKGAEESSAEEGSKQKPVSQPSLIPPPIA